MKNFTNYHPSATTHQPKKFREEFFHFMDFSYLCSRKTLGA